MSELQDDIKAVAEALGEEYFASIIPESDEEHCVIIIAACLESELFKTRELILGYDHWDSPVEHYLFFSPLNPASSSDLCDKQTKPQEWNPADKLSKAHAIIKAAKEVLSYD